MAEAIMFPEQEELPTESVFLNRLQLEALTIALSDSSQKCVAIIEQDPTLGEIRDSAQEQGITEAEVRKSIKEAKELAKYLMGQYSTIFPEIKETLTLLETPKPKSKPIITR